MGAANHARARRAQRGLPAGGEQVVTTQTVEVWRNKVKSEERSKNALRALGPESFAAHGAAGAGAREKRPIRAKATPPHAAPASERIDAGNKHDPATARTGVGAFQRRSARRACAARRSRHLGIVGAANHGKFGSTIWAQAHANVGAASTAGTSKRSARTAASHASTVKHRRHCASSTSASRRRRAPPPPTPSSAAASSCRSNSPPSSSRSRAPRTPRVDDDQLGRLARRAAAARGGARARRAAGGDSARHRAVLAARPHVAPSPPPLGLTRPVSKDGDALAVPLCEARVEAALCSRRLARAAGTHAERRDGLVRPRASEYE